MTDADPSRYADGRLDPAARHAFDPPCPSRADWKRVSDGIAARVLPKTARIHWSRWLAGGAAALAACAAALLMAFGTPKPPAPRPSSPEVAVKPPAPPVPTTDPLAAFGELPIATADEIRIATLRGDWGTGLVVSPHLLPGAMQLATADDVIVARLPDDFEDAPEFGDMPMILGLRGK